MLENKLDCLGHSKGLLLAFAVGFIIRLVPELLSFPHPIGWDTIYYAYRIEDGALFGYWDTPFSSWLLTGILIFLGNLTRLQPFMLLKIVAPLLYGGVTAGIYFVAWKKLNWSATKSLLAVVMFAFSLAALAISWQFYRNIFGLMVLLFALPFIRKNVSWRDTAVLSLLGLLIAWGHELPTISLFCIVLGSLILSLMKKEKMPYRLFVAILPAFIVFFGNFLWVSSHVVKLNENLIWLHDSVWAHPADMFFLTDYLTVSTPIESYSSYFELFYHVGFLFIMLYAVLLPLIAVGYFKDRTFNVWALLLLLGGFGCLIIPFSALLLWARWMLMLIIPFIFFAANGLWKVTKSLEGFTISTFLGWLKVTKKVGYCLLLLSIILGGLFMAWPLVDGKYGLFRWPGTSKYVPSTMQASSVPLRDVEGVTEAYVWLNSNMENDSSLIVHDVFEFWTLLYLDRNNVAYFFDSSLEAALTSAVDNGFEVVYLVWWNQDIGWHELELPNSCVSVYDSGRISVYKLA